MALGLPCEDASGLVLAVIFLCLLSTPSNALLVPLTPQPRPLYFFDENLSLYPTANVTSPAPAVVLSVSPYRLLTVTFINFADSYSLISFVSYDVGRTWYQTAILDSGVSTWGSSSAPGGSYQRITKNPQTGEFVATFDDIGTLKVYITPDGVSWTRTLAQPSLFGVQLFQVKFGSTGTCLSVYAGGGANPDVYALRSTNGCRNFTLITVGLGIGFSLAEFAGGVNGRWVVVFPSRSSIYRGTSGFGTDGDILSVVSIDDGLTWSSTVIGVNTYATTDSLKDFDTNSVLGFNGSFWMCMWQSYSGFDGTGAEGDILMASTVDGITWSTPRVITLGAYTDPVNMTDPNENSYIDQPLNLFYLNGAWYAVTTTRVSNQSTLEFKDYTYIFESFNGFLSYSIIDTPLSFSIYQSLPSLGALVLLDEVKEVGFGFDNCFGFAADFCQSSCVSTTCPLTPSIYTPPDPPYTIIPIYPPPPAAPTPPTQAITPSITISSSLSPSQVDSPSISPSPSTSLSPSPSSSAFSSGPSSTSLFSPSAIPSPTVSILSPSLPPSLLPSGSTSPTSAASTPYTVTLPFGSPSSSSSSSPSSSFIPSLAPQLSPVPSGLAISSESIPLPSVSPSVLFSPSSSPSFSSVPSVTSPITSTPVTSCAGNGLTGSICVNGVWSLTGIDNLPNNITLQNGNYSISSNSSINLNPYSFIQLNNSQLVVIPSLVINQSASIILLNSTLLVNGSIAISGGGSLSVSAMSRSRITEAPIIIQDCLIIDSVLNLTVTDVSASGSFEIKLIDFLSTCPSGFSQVKLIVNLDDCYKAKSSRIVVQQSSLIVQFDADFVCLLSHSGRPQIWIGFCALLTLIRFLLCL